MIKHDKTYNYIHSSQVTHHRQIGRKNYTVIKLFLYTYWTKPSPLSKNSMHTIFDNGRGCVQISVLVLPLIF